MKFLKNLLAALLGCFIALGLLFLLAVGMIGALMPAEETVTVAPSSILRIELSSAIGEQTVSDPLDLSSIAPIPMASGSSSIGILDAVRAIDYAATDPSIKFIYLTDCGYSSGISYMEELRGALERFRASGKPVIAYGDNFSFGGYYLASVADKIYADEFASNNILGMATTIIFLKDVLDRFGVEMQLIRHGKYKSAGEQFIASDISEANREQNQAMVDALWKAAAGSICESREISLTDLDRMVNNLELNTAQDMVDAGLVDELCTVNGMEENLRTLAGAEKLKDVKMITLDKYIKARIKTNYKAKDKIAIIYADGQINPNGSDGITEETFQPIIRDLRADSSVKAVVLRVNSPGGSVQPAEIIRTELELLQQEKPLIVSYGTMAASGGYWISAGADKIYSNSTTLTGSIGVFSMLPSLEKTFKDIAHVNPVTIRSHAHADMGSMTRKLNRQEVAAFQEQVEMIYDHFINIVAEGRGMTPERVDEIAQGRVWCGSEALDINLVNEIGGLKEALDYAAVSAGLDNYRIESWPKVRTSLDKLMEGLGTASAAVETFSDPEQLMKNLFQSVRAEKGIYARVPYIYCFE
ncbi:MAG TPA: signal peptide peptidase SppA [Candidatus Coprenecus avistercoris]|uniref:Signal peptide peptidase SppA n=1 Tax=Candidatus Coprenecus avistercoris TaxID=2840730 RepID=A0A9D1E1W3_9BACT|nr:signal peptide peptidase SppA [Candidatus Coprenecus avistercoris]